MDTTKNVIQVFEIIAHRRLQLGTNTAGAIDLAAAQILLEPRIHTLRQQVTTHLEQRGVDDSPVESRRSAEAVTAFVVGILAGLDLARRPDIVSKFARLYAVESRHSVDSLFNNNVH